MIELKLNSLHYYEILKKGYSLDMIFLLKLISETDEDYTFGTPGKTIGIIQTMRRKGLLTDADKITEDGKELLKFISSVETTPKLKRKKKEEKDDEFEQWWKAFPGTDTFEFKGRKFKGTRALRVKKDDCKAKIAKIINEGEYTISELVQALKLEIQQKAENSIKTGQNKMSFFQNSLTYLNQRTFEPYLELIKAGHKVEEESKTVNSGGVEI